MRCSVLSLLLLTQVDARAVTSRAAGTAAAATRSNKNHMQELPERYYGGAIVWGSTEGDTVDVKGKKPAKVQKKKKNSTQPSIIARMFNSLIIDPNLLPGRWTYAML